MKLQKSPLFKRMIALAKRLAVLCDELTGARGELVKIAESYADERKLCIRCGTPLDEDMRCPVCCKREAEDAITTI
ncbi:MAG: hypothetical protein JXR84_01150 [Anaerolineae bacterium]|nr:hypothetical protein [Anaerolineae bacterium]